MLHSMLKKQYHKEKKCPYKFQAFVYILRAHGQELVTITVFRQGPMSICLRKVTPQI